MLLIRLKENIILDLLNKESVEENDIIFIKDKDATLTLILKRQRSQLSIGSRKKKKKLRILIMLLLKKKDNKNSKEKDLKDSRLYEKITSQATCNACKKEVKFKKHRIRRRDRY